MNYQEKTSAIADVISALAAESPKMIDDLRYVSTFPSVRSEPLPGAPFGAECARCLDASAELYRAAGFRTEVFPESGYALVYFRDPEPGEKYIGIFCHTDVVPVEPSDWLFTQPFTPVERDGMLIGRGVSDNKSSVAAMLHIFIAMRKTGYEPEHNLVVFLGSNEESGMGDARAFIREQPLPAASLVPDASFPVSFGERGIVRLDLRSREPLHDVLSISGGAAYNTVMGLLDCEIKEKEGLLGYLLETGKGFIAAEAGDGVIKLRVTGIPAHAGKPFLGDSALRRLSAVLADCPMLDPSDRETFGKILRDTGDPYGEGLGIAITDDVQGKLTSANGIVRTVDGRIEFTLDIRYGKVQDRDELKEKLRAFFDAQGFDFRSTTGTNAFRIDPDDPLGKVVVESYREFSGNPEATYYYMTGGTYAKYLPHAFAVGVYSGNFLKWANFPAGHGKAHESDEAIGLAEYKKGAGILAGMLLRLDGAVD